jgi:hypothetical protein
MMANKNIQIWVILQFIITCIINIVYIIISILLIKISTINLCFFVLVTTGLFFLFIVINVNTIHRLKCIFQKVKSHTLCSNYCYSQRDPGYHEYCKISKNNTKKGLWKSVCVEFKKHATKCNYFKLRFPYNLFKGFINGK